MVQITIQPRNSETMSYKFNPICLKSTLLIGLLLLLQPVFSQYNFTELDEQLQQKQKLLGNNLVAMVWTKDSIVYKKEMGDFNSKTQAPIASCSKWSLGFTIEITR